MILCHPQLRPGARVGLLRHGETTAGGFRGAGSDDPLTPAGEQAMWQAVGERPRWQRVVCSPLQRCHGPASRFAAAWDVPLQVEPRLRELHFGDWEGQTAEALMHRDADALGRFWQDPLGHPPPNGESLAAFRDRVLGAWSEALVEPGDRVLAVTHAGVIRLLRAHLAGWPLEQLLAIEVPLASLHLVEPQSTEAGS